ncbi:phage tail tip lysozyme [Komagataeibacter sp. FNDCF1]|uniref:phage tail tip lysozyme n=1 Tax=Komagataeibacter sp. FNDCF1 TaxID=2878681 RepID=UPI001E476AA4|nr:phage tail tip lysozyme [Komagataeibacter sp. FNDCF1]MCE2563383.1 phage tail-type lysozyme domain-containing protein [Komagataeibacter sp. FNDCF1]
MPDANVLQEFLVSLGWDVDQRGGDRFRDQLKSIKIGAITVTAALTGLAAAVAKTAQTYEQMHYASQRAQSSVTNMNAFGFAVGQLGGNAQTAKQSLQELGNRVRNLPGMENSIQRFGVQTRDANGHMRDMADIVTDMGQRFRDDPIQGHALAWAQAFGLSQTDMQALERAPDLLRKYEQEYRRIYSSLDLNQDQAGEQSAQFMQDIRVTWQIVEAIGQKVMIDLQKAFGGNIHDLNNYLMQHGPEIAAAIELGVQEVVAFVQWLIKAGKAINSGVENTVGWKVVLEGIAAFMATRWIAGVVTPILMMVRALGGGSLAAAALRTALMKIGEPAAAAAKALGGVEAAGAAAKGAEAAGGAATAAEGGAEMFGPPTAAEARVQAAWNASRIAPAAEGAEAASGAAFGAPLAVIGGAAAFAGYEGYKAWGDVHDAIRAVHKRHAVSDSTAAREKQALQFFIGKGFSPQASAGIVGNLEQESGLNPEARGDSGRAGGVAQWHSDRARAIYQQFGIDVYHANLSQQLEAIFDEMQMGSDPQARQAGRDLYRTNDAAMATHIFRAGYERPLNKFGDEDQKRWQFASDAMSRNPQLFNAANGGGAPSQSVSVNNHVTINGAQSPQAVGKAVSDYISNRTTSAITRNLMSKTA